MSTKTQLPDKPSELIRAGLEDLKKCEADDGYRICMADWHSPSGQVCTVCFAGSVMAKSLGADKLTDFDPYQFADGDKLDALNSFRAGDVAEGLMIMGLPNEGFSDALDLPGYEDSPVEFHKAMAALADTLEKAGL